MAHAYLSPAVVIGFQESKPLCACAAAKGGYLGKDGCEGFCVRRERFPALFKWLRGRSCSGRRGGRAHGLAVPPKSGRRGRVGGEGAGR